MTNSNAVRFAIIGCGMMGQRHAEVLRATPGAAVTVVMDRTPEQAEKIKEDARVATSFEEAAAADDVDAIVICLPSSMHAEVGIMAAKAGKHVVTEKPIDVEADAGRRLAKTCKAAGVVCAVISQNRFSDGAQALKAAVDAGTLGRTVLADASVKWFRHDPYYTGSDWRGTFAGEGGGVIMNQGIHSLDLLVWLFGAPVEVKGLTRSNREIIETEDIGIASVAFANNTLATVTVSTSTFPGFPERLGVHGMKGSLVLEQGKPVFWKHEDELPEPKAPTFASPTEGLSPKLTLFQRQYRNILGAIAGTEKLLVTPEEAIAVVEFARAIYAK